MTTTDVNFWSNMETGEGFLSYLRDSSNARLFCRKTIRDLVEQGSATSILEVGIGGLNEISSLDSFFQTQPKVVYRGTDWTETFVEEARKKYPRYGFKVLDITQCGAPGELVSDIVYSQHVLEHCPGLNPPLSNMLQLTRKVLLNIFFLQPGEHEKIDPYMYPLYHNCYAVSHIMKVCEHHGFEAKLYGFDNGGNPAAHECQQEVVLVALRK